MLSFSGWSHWKDIKLNSLELHDPWAFCVLALLLLVHPVVEMYVLEVQQNPQKKHQIFQRNTSNHETTCVCLAEDLLKQLRIRSFLWTHLATFPKSLGALNNLRGQERRSYLRFLVAERCPSLVTQQNFILGSEILDMLKSKILLLSSSSKKLLLVFWCHVQRQIDGQNVLEGNSDDIWPVKK